MASTLPQESFDACLRTLKIIAFALLQGVVVFLVIALFVRSGKPPMFADPGASLASPITWTALAMAVVGLPLSLVLPGRIAESRRRAVAAGTWTPPASNHPNAPPPPTTDAGRLLLIYQSSWILGSAIAEAVAFFGTIAFFIEGSLPGLLAGLAGLVVLASRFPTRPGVEAWLGDQQMRLDQERTTGS